MVLNSYTLLGAGPMPLDVGLEIRWDGNLKDWPVFGSLAELPACPGAASWPTLALLSSCHIAPLYYCPFLPTCSSVGPSSTPHWQPQLVSYQVLRIPEPQNPTPRGIRDGLFYSHGLSERDRAKDTSANVPLFLYQEI
ncbi:hypothetical protein XENTR_v10010657 [Xenopus tropicalis]|nr:hypothetical protein XENTR_v10010657 [Xenopus tropicalis]